MRRKGLLAIALACGISLAGCSGASDSSVSTTTSKESTISKETVAQTENSTTEAETTEAETTEAGGVYVLPKPDGNTEKIVLKAADAKGTGNVKIKGEGDLAYAEGLETDGDIITFEVDIPEGYFFDITVYGEGIGGSKINYLAVDGEQAGSFTLDNDKIKSGVVNRVYIESGSHKIDILKSWGYIKVTGLELNMCDEMDASMYNVSTSLVDTKADDCAKRLWSYLTDIYGKQMLTGQYIDQGEIDAILSVTDKRPAVWGYDLGYYSSSSIAHGGKGQSVDTIIRLHDANPSIIFTLCWHWLAPDKYLKDSSEQPWYSGFRKEATTMDLTKIMNGEDEEGYQLILDDIDLIAEQLKLLEEAEVPILWRPLHEASGGWFWWGAFGADTYKKLYTLMYDRLVNYHGIHNLIWLWNGQSADWYPGDEYVDIIGEDIYAGNQVDSSQASKFFEAASYTESNKMVVLSENGCIPDIDKCRRDGAMWGFYAVWNGEFVKTSSIKAEYSENYTSKEILKKMYDSEYAITLDEVPDLNTYNIK